jgi:RNA polymerase sigma-70 factor (ECF subfamily)
MTGPARLTSDLDALLRRVANGDRDAFAAVYDLTNTRVYGLVTRVLRDTGYSEGRPPTTPPGVLPCPGC